jgi:hypothetical protein
LEKTASLYGWLADTYPFLPMQVLQFPLPSLNMPLTHILSSELVSIEVPV